MEEAMRRRRDGGERGRGVLNLAHDALNTVPRTPTFSSARLTHPAPPPPPAASRPQPLLDSVTQLATDSVGRCGEAASSVGDVGAG